MGQRINIQYSVDIDDLGEEVQRHIEDTFARYLSLQTHCGTTDGDVLLSHEMIEKIDKIRLELAAIDHRLNDASNIIYGYLHYRAQENMATPPAVADIPRETLGERPDVSDLEHQLAQFNNLIKKKREPADEISNQGK